MEGTAVKKMAQKKKHCSRRVWELLRTRRVALFVNVSRLNMGFKECAAEIVFTPVISNISKRVFAFCVSR
jgi:hypothetical protein